MSRYGAIDIGSNSIRMLAADVVPGKPPVIVAEDREVTRLGEGVFREGRFGREATEQTVQVLARMASTLQDLHVLALRAVATSAVRDAHDRQEFLDRLEQTIGAPVDVISGQEESRLIHLGVQTAWPHNTRDILIVDIGGGSAEVIFSHKRRIAFASSKPLGAVRLKASFLQDDPPGDSQLQQLQDYIHEKLAPARRRLGSRRPNRTIATSATAAAIARAVHKIPRSKRDLADKLRVPRARLRQLYESLSRKTLQERRQIVGIGPRRAEVVVPGCAVLLRILEEFRLPSFYYSRAGVRDGVIADLAQRGVGRERTELDSEQRQTVREMARRYGVSLRHADKVASLSQSLFRGLQSVHGQPPDRGKLLEAAAYLHDVGHFISDSRHHKHSFYVVMNSDLPGFTYQERLLVANLCRYHRKAMPSEQHDNFKPVDAQGRETIRSLVPLLRVADSLDRAHEQHVKDVRLRINGNNVELMLESNTSTKLEEWAVQQVRDIFEKIYGRLLTVRQVRP